MSSGGGNTTTTTKSDPWSGQQDYLAGVFGQARNTYNNQMNSPGQGVAGFTPDQQTAMNYTNWIGNNTNVANAAYLNNNASNYANNLMNGAYLGANPGNAAYSQFASGKMLDNPYMTGMANAAADATTRAYQTATAPQTASAFAGAGRYGSGAYQNAVDQNQQDLAKQLGNQMNNLYGGIYQNNMENMLQGAQGLSSNYNVASQQQLQGAINAPNQVNSVNSAISNLYNMGGNQQALQQAQINAPWQQLGNYSNLVQGQYGGTSATTQPYYQNKMAGGMGGAMSGAMMGSMFGPVGMGIGAIGGGLLGMM